MPKRPILKDGEVDVTDATAEDFTDVTYPKGVPKNPDGTIKAEDDIDVETVQEIGSVDPVSAQKNRTNTRLQIKKAVGEKKVRWGAKQWQDVFDNVRSTFNPDGITIYIRRVEPVPEVDLPCLTMASCRTASQLQANIQKHHRASRLPFAKYIITYKDSGGTGYQRGTGEMCLTEEPTEMREEEKPAPPPPPQPQQQPYANGYAPYGFGGPAPGQPLPPWGGPPSGYPPYGYPYQPPQQQPPPAPVHVEPAPPPPPAVAPVQPPPPGVDPATYAYMQWLAAQSQGLESKVSNLSLQLEKLVGVMLDRQQQPAPAPPAPPQPQYAPPPQWYAHPQGVGAVPPPPAPAPAPVSPPVQAAPPASPLKQIQDSVSAFSGLAQSMKEFQGIWAGMSPAQASPIPTDDPFVGAELPPEDDPPIRRVDMGTAENPIPVAYDRSDNVAWAPTLLSLAPKLIEGAKSVLDGFKKMQDQQLRMVEMQYRLRSGQPLPSHVPEAVAEPVSTTDGVGDIWGRPPPTANG